MALDRGRLAVDGHCLALLQAVGVIEIPPAAFACILLEPGVSITHEAVKLCAENRTQLMWVGEEGTKIYASGQQHHSPRRVIQQSRLHLDGELRIEAARKLYKLMFEDEPPPSFSIEKLRGIEGARVKSWYAAQCRQLGIDWQGRQSHGDLQQCISFATGCLHHLAEVAINILGFSPAIGIVPSGDRRSFVYDLADTVKFDGYLRYVLEWYGSTRRSDYGHVRIACRDIAKERRLLDRLIFNAEEVINAGGDSCSE